MTCKKIDFNFSLSLLNALFEFKFNRQIKNAKNVKINIIKFFTFLNRNMFEKKFQEYYETNYLCALKGI